MHFSALNLTKYVFQIASTTVNVENEALNVDSKVVLRHADITIDATHVITQVLR